MLSCDEKSDERKKGERGGATEDNRREETTDRGT